MPESLSQRTMDRAFLEQQRAWQLDIADLFATVFSQDPWNEDWTQESALETLRGNIHQAGFFGVLLSAGPGRRRRLVGFSWGYQLPVEGNGDGRTNECFQKILVELARRGLDPARTFYGAETVIHPEFRRRGLAAQLLDERTKRNDGYRTVVFRTKNPFMVRAYRRVFNQEGDCFPEESAYAGGRVHIFQR